jgi:hypothetical protein
LLLPDRKTWQPRKKNNLLEVNIKEERRKSFPLFILIVALAGHSPGISPSARRLPLHHAIYPGYPDKTIHLGLQKGHDNHVFRINSGHASWFLPR